MLREAAPAKINLTLHVTGKRADGYHLLDSLVVFAGAQDVVGARPASGLSLALTGPFAPGLAADPDNLVLRAARALAEAAGVTAGAELTLEKNLPVASGIGGGSSDAAAALRVLGRLWNVRLPADQLAALAAGLGADVPVCLDPRPRVMQGVGDILGDALALPACGILLVNPGVGLGTQAVFRARAGGFSRAPLWPPSWPDTAALAEDLRAGANDLQAPAIGLCPLIGDVLDGLATLPGALLARMSGSGATCFALFASAEQAEAASGALVAPAAWWRWGGPLYDPAAPP
jgi:4-diphosphocytidyl-2-C-methyl-D-erythritol kinase